MEYYDEVHQEVDLMERQANYSKSMIIPSNKEVFDRLVKRLKGKLEVSYTTGETLYFACDNGTTIFYKSIKSN